MDEHKMDRRVRRTKKQLRMALTSLMMEKSIGEITVREIAELADVNRGTFYSHYKDVNDLLRHLEDNIFVRLEEVRLANDPADANGDIYDYLTAILTLVGENADIYMALICNNGDIAFHNQLVSVLKNQYIREFLRLYYPTDEKTTNYLCSFIISGMLSITKDWLCDHQRARPEVIAGIGREIIMKGVGALK